MSETDLYSKKQEKDQEWYYVGQVRHPFFRWYIACNKRRFKKSKIMQNFDSYLATGKGNALKRLKKLIK
jgi:glutathione peroxidase-family protein